MSKKNIIITICIVVVVAGVIGGVVWKRSVSKSPMLSRAGDFVGKKISFAEFIKGAGSYQCNVNQTINGTETKGKVYFTKGLIRGEFSSLVRGINVDTNFIARDGYSYTWSSMMPRFGFKAKINPNAMNATSTAGTSGAYSFNANQVGDYTCEAWTIDQSKFTVPTSVIFREALN